MIVLNLPTTSVTMVMDAPFGALGSSAFFVDVSANGRAPGQLSALADTGDHVEIVPAPAAGEYREVTFTTILNGGDPTYVEIHLKLEELEEGPSLFETRLGSRSTLMYTKEDGFRVVNNDGELLTGPAGFESATPTPLLAATDFGNSARYVETSDGGGSSTFDAEGLTCETSATVSSSCKETWAPVSSDNGGGVLTTFPAEASFSLILDPVGSDVQAFVGLGDIAGDGTSGIDFTSEHIGFKVVRSSGGTIELSATQADGTTEASVVLTAVDAGDQLDLALTVREGVAYYRFRLNGSDWSGAEDLDENLPDIESAVSSFMVSNAGVATNSALVIKSASYRR